MVFNDEGFLVDTLMKINPVGKRLTITDDKIDNRKNIILLGDILPDVNMAQNLTNENMIAIGFLNRPKKIKDDIKRYLTKFDIVIINDGSWKEPLRILRKILWVNPNWPPMPPVYPNEIFKFASTKN